MYVVERKIDNSHVTRKGKWHNVYPGVQYETREQALAHKPDNAREKSSYMTITYNYRVAKLTNMDTTTASRNIHVKSS